MRSTGKPAPPGNDRRMPRALRKRSLRGGRWRYAYGTASCKILDLDTLGGNYALSGMGWSDGDFNDDGIVDILDLDILGSNWGGGAVPEPTAGALLTIGTLALLRRRDKK